MSLPLQKIGKLDRMETASIDELRHEQLQRLRWSVTHAYTNVPFYRKAFDDIGLKPMDIRSLEDLAKIPFTTKADLRDNYPFGMFATPMSDVVRIHASSGTTGKPTVVGYTQKDIDNWANIVARCIRAAGGTAATRSTWPTATVCSPAVSAPITVPSAWAVPSSPCPAARPRNRSS